MQDDIEDIFTSSDMPEVEFAVAKKPEAKPVSPGRQSDIKTAPSRPTEVRVATLGSKMEQGDKLKPARKILGMNARERAVASGLLFLLTVLVVLTVLASLGAIGA